MFVLIFIVSFLATMLSAMSGAGSGMITIPTWLLMGFPLPVALASNQVTGALWTPIAARNYLRGQSVDLTLLTILILFGLIGAYFGTKVVAGFNAEVLQRIIGFVILALVVLVSSQKKFGIEASPPKANRLVAGLLAVPLGFYEAFFGSGNGIFTSTMLTKTRGFDLVTALGYYYLISFTWDAFAASLYVIHGYGSLDLIIPSSIGSLAGAYLGSLIGRSKGSQFVKYLFVALGGVLGLKLAIGF